MEAREERLEAGLDEIVKKERELNKKLIALLKKLPLLPSEKRKDLRWATSGLNSILVENYDIELNGRQMAILSIRQYHKTGKDIYKHLSEGHQQVVNDIQRRSEMIRTLIGGLMDERTLFRRQRQARVATYGLIVALLVFALAQFLDRLFP